MSYPPQPSTYRPAPPPPAKRSRLPLILSIAIGVPLVIVIALAALGAALDNGKPAATPAPSAAAGAGARAPKATDFSLTAKVTEQTCYGEAGCAVTWLPVVAYTGPAIDDGKTWAVSYEVTGVESGTTVGKVLMGSNGPAKQAEKRGRTSGKDKKITLKVTGVEPA